MKKLTLFLLLFMLFLPLARAQVSIGATDYGSDLQSAINAAASNDIITVTGTLNISSNVDLGLGADNLTIEGTSSANLVFSSNARLIFEQAKSRSIKSLTMDGDSTNDRGGIIKLGNSANLTLDGVTLSGGRSASHGGAIANGGSTLTARNSTFTDNRCALSGGAIFNDGNGSISLFNCKFQNNWAAAFQQGADGKGGAIAMIGSNTPGLYAEGCLFYKNISRNHGGAFIFENATGKFINCTLAQNQCYNDGGVAFLWGPVALTFINSTLAYNTTQNSGNGPCIKNLQATNTLIFDNCILYENRNAGGAEFDIQSDVADDIFVNNSVLSGYSNVLSIIGSGNILKGDVVNLELAADINADGVLTLAKGSQAVDLGDGAFLTAEGIDNDQLGKTRNFAGGKVDAGAFELNSASGAGHVTLNGTSFGIDFGGAMLAAADGDTVKIFGLIDISQAKNIDDGGNKVVIKGYDGATFKFSSAGGPGTGSRFNWANNANTGVVRTFKDIDMIGDPNGQSDAGAIINMTRAGTLNLENVSMSGGYCTQVDGGAIRITGAGALLNATNCLFTNNKAFNSGGAIFIGNTAHAVIKNSKFLKNQAALRLTDGKGGAIGVNGSPILGLYAENCAFSGNKSFNNGGTFLIENSKATVINSTIFNDSCQNAGGVAFIWTASTVTFINNTIAFNGTLGSQGAGSGLKNCQSSNSITVRNCYFYKNGSGDGLFQDINSDQANSNVTASGSILGGGVNTNTLLSGGVNIVGTALVKPGIAESLNGDYLLPLIDSTGQAINLGDTTGIASLISVDQRYQPRNFQYGRVDAGAYEMQDVVGVSPGIWPDSSAFRTYTGLSMSGYQGWFSAKGDGSGQDWVHYGKGGSFAPGSVVLDFWPDMREASAGEKFATPFRKGNDTAFVYSPYIAPTVNRHFQWMSEYGVDGVFMQRFVADIMNPTTKARLNQVLKNALQAAKANDRAISIMYDLSGIDTTAHTSQDYLDIIEADWNELKGSIGISTYGDDNKGINQPLLYHKSKGHGGKSYPLVTIWGVGFNDGRKYNVNFVSRLVDFFQHDQNAGECAVMLGVPTYWRTGGSDVVTGTEYTRLIALLKKVDIVLPWHTGRFDRTAFNNNVYKDLVAGDVAWCNTNNVDYAPVLSPGFSWRNLKNDPNSGGKPREGGLYYWDMARAALQGGAKMLYTGMFDEMNEGTQIFKIDNNPPANPISFLTYDTNPEDYYLWLSGEIRRDLKGETTMGATIPARANETGFTSTYTITRSNDVAGSTALALMQATSGHKIYYADPYSVPDGAPSLNIARDISLFVNELTIIRDTLSLNTFDQYLRLVEVDANDKVVGYKTVLLDTSLVGSIADSTGFTDPAVNFRASYVRVGYTVLEGNPSAGNTYWAAPVQEIADFTAPFYRTARDTGVFKVPMTALANGIAASEGNFVPVIEVNGNNEILGFKVFRITRPQIGRLISDTDVMHSSIVITYAGSTVNVKITGAEGYLLYRTDPISAAAAVPFYGAPFTGYADIFKRAAITQDIKFVTGQVLSFVEVKNDAVVAYTRKVLNPIPPVSVTLKADPDLNKGEFSVVSLGETPAAGHKVFIYPTANPKDESPRIGQDYAEIAPLYTKEVAGSGISVPAKVGDIYFLVETDGENAVAGFSQLILAAENISIFANPAVHVMQSVYTVSAIGETNSGQIDMTVTPAAGFSVYRSGIMPVLGRVPVYKSKVENNPEFTQVSSPVSLSAAMGDNLMLIEYNAAGELAGISIEEARDSALLVYYVDEFGNDANNGTKYRPFKTLETALVHVTRVAPIDSAVTIHVSGNIQLQNPAVAGDGTPISGSVKLIGSKGATIMAATNNRVLELINAEYYFENITITGGRATSVNGGAGVYLHGDRNTKATFKNCSFSDNRLIAPTGVLGGGIRIVGANATFISCIFQGNHGRNRGGAIAIAHGAVDAEADYKVTFDGCYIANNISEYLSGNVEGHGGAFFITNNEGGNLDVDIINSTIQANQANSAGGAMFIEGSALSNTKIKVINSAITDNWGLNAGNGHGIRMVGAADNTLEIYNSLLWDNSNAAVSGSDGSNVDIRNDAGSVITCQQSYVEALGLATTLTGVYETGERTDLGVLKAALPAGYASSLFINNPNSFLINYGTPSYLTDAGVDWDATFTARNAADGKIDAGPTEYNELKFDKLPQINNPIADVEVAKNAAQTVIDLTEVFTDRDGDPFTYSVSSNNNESVVEADPQGTDLVLTYATDMEGDAKIVVRGTTNNKFVEEEFVARVGYAPYVDNPVPDISIPNQDGGDFTVDMTDVFADPDDDASEITLSVIGNTDSHLVSSASMDGKTLNYSVQPGDQGIVVLTVKAKAGIRTALTTVTLIIGRPPVVVNLIPSVAAKVNSAPVTRDLTNTFVDPDVSDPSDQIVKSIENNSNPALVIPSIVGNTLTMTFAPNKTGQAVITVKALSGELTVTTSFNVLITLTDQFVVLNPIQPVMVAKNAPDSVVNLSNVFYNMADPNAQIVITMTGNSNSSLVTAELSGNDLTLGFAPNMEGSSEITLHAVCGNATLDHKFLVGVGEVDLLTIMNQPADIQIANDPLVETRIDLSGIFAVVGKPDEVVTIDFSFTNPLLLNAYINTSTNELVISSANSNVGTCEFTLTGTYGNATISTKFMVTIIVTGVENRVLKAVKLYPVPATTILFCSFADDDDLVESISTIQIISLTGMVVKIFDQSVIANHVAELNVEDLPKGSYLLRINSTQGSVTKMFIK